MTCYLKKANNKGEYQPARFALSDRRIGCLVTCICNAKCCLLHNVSISNI